MADTERNFSRLYRRCDVTSIVLSILLEEEVESGRHRGRFNRRCLHVKTQSGVAYGLSRSSAEASDLDLILLELWEIFKQRVDTRRTEEEQHIVIERFVRTEVIAHSAVHDRLRIIYIVVVEDIKIFLMYIAHGIQITFFIMLEQIRQKVIEFAGIDKE